MSRSALEGHLLMSSLFALAGRAALAVALAAGVSAAVPTGTAEAGQTCDPVLGSVGPAHRALGRLDRADRTTVAALNDASVSDLTATAAADDTLWLDRCGMTLYVDDATRQREEPVDGATTAPAAPLVAADQTFTLQSRPGSARTLYLDFVGATVRGTAWNDTVGQSSITVPAYTNDGSSAFSKAELAEIQRAWAVVAEDYAPFDVNVTTRDLGTAAIDRTGPTDGTYGARVIVTAGGPVWEAMGKPGGISYTGVLDRTSKHAYYQPSWVFTKSLGTASGKEIGEAAAHEAGHSFGLSHDGASGTAYYRGSGVWAPIMGAAYYAPVTQWSKGEYAGATNTEDDTAIIAKVAPYVADDHAGTADRATPLSAGTPRTGLIGTRSDTDAFALAASGATTVTVTPTALQPDLDVALTVYDAAGTVVTRANPAAASRSASEASGLDATATFTAPAAGARYTVVVDGAGTGDPRTAGRYSDYGSLGAYRVEFATAGRPTGVVLPSGQSVAGTTTTATPPPSSTGTAGSSTPPSATGKRLARGKAGRRYRASARLGVRDGGLRWRRTGVIPAGVRLAIVRGRVLRVTGRPRKAGTFRFVLVGRGRGDLVVRRPFELVVRR